MKREKPARNSLIQKLTKMPPLIILAAGNSTRMGTPKGLVQLGEQSLLEHILLAAAQASITRTILVTGEHHSYYAKFMINLPYKVKFAHNPHAHLGQFSSVISGLEAIEAEECFVTTIDTPLLHYSIFEALLTKMAPDADAAVPTFKGRGGHPIYLSKIMRDEILLLKPQMECHRLDKFLAKKFVSEVELPFQEVTCNINSQSELGEVERGLGF